jgi:hypothetical protein
MSETKKVGKRDPTHVYSPGATEAIALAKSKWKNGVEVERIGASLEVDDSEMDRLPASKSDPNSPVLLLSLASSSSTRS